MDDPRKTAKPVMQENLAGIVARENQVVRELREMEAKALAEQEKKDA